MFTVHSKIDAQNILDDIDRRYAPLLFFLSNISFVHLHLVSHWRLHFLGYADLKWEGISANGPETTQRPY